MSFWDVLPVAFALMLVIEGMLPFINPRAWKSMVATIAALDDAAVRRFGLGSMVLGLLLLYLVN
ncbi:MAG: DUF2065 family protein [Pseudomonadota bacterium]